MTRAAVDSTVDRRELVELTTRLVAAGQPWCENIHTAYIAASAPSRCRQSIRGSAAVPAGSVRS